MKKGVESEVEGNKCKVLDTRRKGTGLEIDVEMSKKTSRRVAVLKLYDPNKAKDYTVMVAKNKDIDNKYVILMSENILKPLIKKYLSDDVDDREEVADNLSDQVKCSSMNN